MTNKKSQEKELEQTRKEFVSVLKSDRKERIKRLKETISDLNPEALFADGFDDSLEGFDSHGRAIYSADGIIQTLIERDGMESEEASEHFSFNIECAYVGEYTPLWMYQE
jgi:hypothetical protein